MLSTLTQRLGDALLSQELSHGDDVLWVQPAGILAALRMLRDDPEFGFDLLSDLFGMDYGTEGRTTPARFAVVYHLTSLPHRRRLRVKAFLPEEAPEIDSAAGLWPSAEWMEREAYDLFGIRFRNHPDLRRILLPEGYDGHPLRKDYPLQGRGERNAFPKYTTQTPLGDLVDEALGGPGGKERLA
jgi:NADH-quinone oxidoreductase subunit C